MTEQRPQPSRTRSRRAPSVYRVVLSITVAALLAAWLPFSILYINALTKHASLIAPQSAGRSVATATVHSAQSAPVVTRTS